MSALEKDQSRRRKRLSLDSIDGVLLDLLSLCRDVVASQLGATTGFVNADAVDQIAALARLWTPESTMRTIDAIVDCREALAANAAAPLALERMMLELRS